MTAAMAMAMAMAMTVTIARNRLQKPWLQAIGPVVSASSAVMPNVARPAARSGLTPHGATNNLGYAGGGGGGTGTGTDGNSQSG
ncbi:hypothetical protein [Mycobacterium vicinigordonae]|uniref:hypothetical protein n=1 Tax=Mycobacterium vicinigordonae TaxID=1719132 RepID=UPI001FE8C47F|nr:hypothetical protein [Mycobacterium vicinigordonae]